jgi:hypothetical protein
MNIKLFLDDDRFPPDDGQEWVIVRTSQEAIDYCLANGVPSFISFDHDLGEDDDAMIFVKWMIETDMDRFWKFIPKDFSFYVHSQNPIGSENIIGLIENYLRNNHRA